MVLEVDVSGPGKLYHLHNNLPFLPKRVKNEINIEKLVTRLYNKEEYAVHIRHLKQELSLELVLKQFYIVIKFNQNVWLNSYIYMTKAQKRL